MTSRPEPLTLRAPSGARALEIDWSDGVTSRLSHVVLRAFCPCAHCQGHQGPVRWADDVDEHADLELREIEEVGSYALRLVFGDGHGTGIYTFRFLRELGDLAELPVAQLRARRFSR